MGHKFCDERIASETQGVTHGEQQKGKRGYLSLLKPLIHAKKITSEREIEDLLKFEALHVHRGEHGDCALNNTLKHKNTSR